VKNKIESRELDVRHLKMFIIDECDEVLNNSKEILGLIINKFKEIGINPMYALFSATVDEKVQNEAE